MSSAEEAIKERERQRKHQEEQQLIQQAFNSQGQLKDGFIEMILNSDDVREGDHDDLDDVTIGKVKSLLSKQWVLSNLTGAQEHDIRFKIEVMKLKILGAHPPDESVVGGKTRAYIYDDPMEELSPLSAQERLMVDDLIETIKGMMTRGREGFERKQMNTTIARSESENRDGKDKGGLSLFGGSR